MGGVETKILIRRQDGSRGGCLNNEGTGTPLRTMLQKMNIFCTY